jgi:hypothetical protein
MSVHLVASDTGRVFDLEGSVARASIGLVRCTLEADPSAVVFRTHMPSEHVLETLVEWVRLCSRVPYRETPAVGPVQPARIVDRVCHEHVAFLREHTRKDAVVWFDQQFVPECHRLMVDDLVRLYTLVVSEFAHALSLDTLGTIEDTDAYTRALGAFIHKLV